MVGKRGTDEARQAAREARRKREKRQKYEALLEEHPKVKAARARIAPRVEKGPVKRGVPRLIAEAMQNKDVATAIAATRRVMKYHHRVGDHGRRRLKGERIPLNDQIALIRQGENIERDFREMLRLAVKVARANPATEAYAAAIAERPDDTEVIDNLPSFFSRDELAAFKYLGVEPQELSETWDQIYTPHRQEVLELMASGKINRRLETREKVAEHIRFPEAPRHLAKQGIITLGGDGVVQRAVTTVVATVVAVVVQPISPATSAAIISAAEAANRASELSEFNAWHLAEQDTSWTLSLPNCPCTLGGTNENPVVMEEGWTPPSTANKYHKGATWEIRSRVIFGIAQVGAGQQCCYTAKRELITDGPGAGTPDKATESLLYFLAIPHLAWDLYPFMLAWSLDDGVPGSYCKKYFEVRPPNNGNACSIVKVSDWA